MLPKELARSFKARSVLDELGACRTYNETTFDDVVKSEE